MAFCVYNNTTDAKVTFEETAGGSLSTNCLTRWFKATNLKPGENQCCHWSNECCNGGGAGDSRIQFSITVETINDPMGYKVYFDATIQAGGALEVTGSKTGVSSTYQYKTHGY